MKITMRKIEFPPGTSPETKERVGAVAWATLRRAQASWKGNNVNEDIRDYISEHSGYVMSSTDINMVFHWVQKQGYGFAKTDPSGKKRLVEFGFNLDVDLTPFPQPPSKLTRQAAKLAGQLQTHMNGATAVLVAPSEAEETGEDTQKGTAPPLPGQPLKPPRYVEAELNKGLDNWAEKDPEAYAEWADAALEYLRTR